MEDQAASVQADPKDAVIPASVLLVDDHISTLDVLERLLKRDGHAIVPARSMAQAMAAAKRHKFDLVVSDPQPVRAPLILRSGGTSWLFARTSGNNLLRRSIQRDFAADPMTPAPADHLAKPVIPAEVVTLVRSLVSLNVSRAN